MMLTNSLCRGNLHCSIIPGQNQRHGFPQVSLHAHRKPSLTAQKRVSLRTRASSEKTKEKESVKSPLIFDDEDAGGDGECEVFLDPKSGNYLEAMCCDYGFRTGNGRMYQEKYGGVPGSIFSLAIDNFKREFQELRRSFRFNEYKQISKANPPKNAVDKAIAGFGNEVVNVFASIDSELESKDILSKLEPEPLPMEFVDEEGKMKKDCAAIRETLAKLKLDNGAVWERERKREKVAPVEANFVIKAAYISLCVVLDVIFDKRPIQRFWFLETVARMPYFGYISMLHLYESLGWWRAGAELRRVHFAEEWNELHHLQIMESLGGDKLWIDRFMAGHAAVFYYWVIVLFFAFSPSSAYQFSVLVEGHAVDTYGEFADANEELLKTLPPPMVALNYYRAGDLYMFDEFQTAERTTPRRPVCNTLYDVFVNIRDDEDEHVKTMESCENMTIMEQIISRKEVADATLAESARANGARKNGA